MHVLYCTGMSLEASKRQKSPVPLAVTVGYFFSKKKKTRENLSSISNTTYSVFIYWSACLRLQIFTNFTDFTVIIKIWTLKFISFTMPSRDKRLKESGKGKQKFDITFFNFVSWYKKWVISLCYTWNKPKLTKSKYAIFNILLSNTIKPIKFNLK